MSSAKTAITALQHALGPEGLRTEIDIDDRYCRDLIGNRGQAPLAVARPRSTGEVSRVLAICHGAGVPVVTQGGHIGDGNLHIAIHQPPECEGAAESIEQAVYALVARYQGSVSAEHGIGMLKRAYLRHSRSPAEIELMRALKKTMDPRSILNPDRIFERR